MAAWLNLHDAASTTAVGSQRVLVVDDDLDTAALMSDALRRRGFDAVELHSAEECLDSLRRLGAAVVVTDVQMPGMSGLQLTCELSSTYPQVRTVIVTGLATAALTAEARQLGAFEVVSKPVRIDDLAKIVRRALESSD